MENPKVVQLDPSNPDHRRLIGNMLAARSAPVAIKDSLSLDRRQAPQKVLTAADLAALERAEAKRQRKALRLK